MVVPHHSQKQENLLPSAFFAGWQEFFFKMQNRSTSQNPIIELCADSVYYRRNICRSLPQSGLLYG